MDAEQAAELKRRRVMLAISGRVKPGCYLDMKGVPEELLLGKKGDDASVQKGSNASKVVASPTNVLDQASNNTVNDPSNIKTDDTLGNVPHDNKEVVITVSADQCSTLCSPSSPLSGNPDTLRSDHASSDSSVIEDPLSDSEGNEEELSLS